MGFWEPEIELELDEGERVVAIRRHHWFLLARNAAIPVAIALLAGGIAVARAIGIGVLTVQNQLRGVFDWINVVLLVFIAGLVVVWVRGSGKHSKGHKLPISLSWLIGIGITMLGVLFLFRYQGGRVLEVDPTLATAFDLINVVLWSVAAVAALAIAYIVIDWRNDALILTTTRVVLFKDELLVRIEQQQILLVDVQQVFLRQNTYPQAIFGFGSLTIQSFSLRKLFFDFCDSPQDMERLIKEQLNRTRKAIEPNLVRRLVQERVFENKPRAELVKKIELHVHGAGRQGILAWFFPPNPRVDEATGTVTWRPSSTYVGLKMLRPFVIWLVATVITGYIAVTSEGALALAALTWALITLPCAAWIVWLREEYVNDVYVLGRREIVDVDQRPFGPIDRRTAPIGNIQNVSSDVSFYEQILGYGTVKIQTGGTGEFSFNHVPDPRGVQALINDYLTDFKRGAEERNLQNSIDIFKEYHELQRDRGELIDRSMLNTTIDERARDVVDEYANNTAPIQIEYYLRRAALRSSLIQRRARVRRLMARRRNQNS